MKKKIKQKHQEIGLVFDSLSPAYKNIFSWWFEPKYAGKNPEDFTEEELEEVLRKINELYNEYKIREELWKKQY
jgi:hypothetical protein